ncbi:MAG: carbamoyltransferase N-terminal domain-containing protein [Brevundimonas sp.]
MIILGIHDGHNSSAALLVDGKLIAALAEERLSRNKRQYGYPERAIQAVLEVAGITIKDVDRIAMATATLPPSSEGT